MTAGYGYSDVERLCLGATWTDDAARWLGDELDRGGVHGTTDETRMKLETLRDGLQVLADTLHAMTLPYPPPAVPPSRNRHLRVVK